MAVILSAAKDLVATSLHSIARNESLLSVA